MNKDVNAIEQNNTDKTKRDWVTKYLYPVILFVYPFLNVCKGADISDTSYSLGNFMFIERMDTAWKYATFLANCLGRFFYLLTGGNMVFMQLLCTLVLAATGVCSYVALGKYISKHFVFIGELIALGVCWTPTVILYNYLTYLLFVLGALLMYTGIRQEKRRLLVFAGLCLGLNVFARTSNLVEVVLIIVVWMDAAKKKGAFWKNTGACVLGYALGGAIGIGMMLISGGIKGITEMITWLASLLTSSDDAGGYSAGGMLDAIIFNYVKQSRWPLMIIFAAILGMIAFKLIKGKLRAVMAGGYFLCTGVLFIYFYRNGCFTSDYFNISCVFGLSAALYVIYAVLFIFLCFRKNVAYQDKLLYLMGLIIILITPLGSNNHLFACINNMFLVAPLFIGMLHAVIAEFNKDGINIPLRIMGAVFITVLLVQSVLMRMNFVFRDSTNGEPRTYCIDADCYMDGMYTNDAHGKSIEDLVQNVRDTQGSENEVLLYGDIPGVSYLLGMPSAISSTWPDLDSYSADKFETELGEIQPNDLPLIIVSKNVADYINGVEPDGDVIFNEDKLILLSAFIDEFDYKEVYSSEEFAVLQNSH